MLKILMLKILKVTLESSFTRDTGGIRPKDFG